MQTTVTCRVHALAAINAIVMAMCTAGCGTWQNIDIHDNKSPSVAVRATVHPEGWTRGDRPGAGLEAGYERYRAHDVHALPSGELVTIDKQTVVGPDTIGQEAVSQQIHLAYTHRLYFGSNFELEPFGGVAWFETKVNLTPAASPLRPGIALRQWGAIGGITPRWRFDPSLAIELRITGMGRDFRYSGVIYDAGLVWAPVQNLALRLGYAKRSYGGFIDDNGSGDVQLNVRARGPSVSLLFDF